MRQQSAPPLYRAYVQRWYILVVYGGAAFMQTFLWNMYGPIFISLSLVYGWANWQLALLLFFGTISFIAFVLPSAWLLERLGLRKLVLLMTFLTAFAVAIRCIPLDTLSTTILINISAFINGIPGAVTFYLPPVISAHWFPPNERRFSTAVGTVLLTAGIAGAFVVGPLFVPEPSGNVTVEEIKLAYYRYTYVEAGVTVALFLAVAFYYPDKPPSPPSESAEAPRIGNREGIVRLLTSVDFWILCAPVTLGFGTSIGWSPVLSIDLTAKNIDQTTAGYMGFYATIAGALTGIVAGKLGDLFGHLKLIMIVCSALSIGSSVWLVLVLHGFVTFSLTESYIAAIVLLASTSAILPVNDELAAEACYPVSEATVVGLLGMIVNAWSCIFYIVLFFPSVGTVWMDWFLMVSCIASLPLTLLIKEKYRRSEVDRRVGTNQPLTTATTTDF